MGDDPKGPLVAALLVLSDALPGWVAGSGRQTHSDPATATLAALLPKWVPGYDPAAPYLYGVGHDPETVPSGLADAMVDAIASVTDLARDRSVEDVDHWTHKDRRRTGRRFRTLSLPERGAP